MTAKDVWMLSRVECIGVIPSHLSPPREQSGRRSQLRLRRCTHFHPQYFTVAFLVAGTHPPLHDQPQFWLEMVQALWLA